MKQNIQYIIFFAGLILLSTACVKMDNYPAPNASFGGIVIDKTTGKGISTEQPLGFRIRWTELSWGSNVKPDYFYAMPDGKFNWDRVFGYANSQYEIVPVEGAFESPNPQTISIQKGEYKDLTFEVIPYIHIDSHYAVKDSILTVYFTATRPDGSMPAGISPYAISQVWILISNKTQYISYQNAGGYDRTLSQRITPFGEAQLGKETSKTITLAPGTYWFRIAIQTRNPSNACNFTPVEKITI